MNPIKLYNYGQDIYLFPDKAYLYTNKYPLINKKRILISDRSINDLLIEPKYKFIETLTSEKCEEYNNAFWEWMYDNNNACVTTSRGIVLNPPKCPNIYIPPPPMLLGYHISFIRELING